MAPRMLCEPSVFWSPYFFSSPSPWTIFTRDQSASSSSATIIVVLVRMPWPISDRCATMLTSPLGSIDRKTFGAKAPAASVAARPSSPGIRPMATPSTRPPPPRPIAVRNDRRLTLRMLAMARTSSPRP